MARWQRTLFITGLLIVAARVRSDGQTKPEAAAPMRTLEVVEVDGGNIANAEYGTVLHKNTSLHRNWFVFNDRTCPVQLSGAGATPVSATAFLLKGDATTSAPVTAIDVEAVLFDLWGEHSMNLHMIKVTDFAANLTFPLSDSDSKWPAEQHIVQEFLTSVTFVRRVRLADGKIWLADMPAVFHRITEIPLTVSKEELEIKPVPK